MSEKSATVAVVIATYNRPDALRIAVESVINQTFTDWSLWVVGDCCTEATSEMMRRYCETDLRINYRNQSTNHGEQSVANNEGVAQSSSKYIAFLNHDDIWFPDHLERTLTSLESTDSDMVWAPCFTSIKSRLRVRPLPQTKHYAPGAGAKVSQWLMKRDLWKFVGPWKDGFKIRNAPSLDWILRASNAGARITHSDVFTVFSVPSASVQNSYCNGAEIQASIWENIQTNALYRESLLSEVAIAHARQISNPPVLPAVRRALLRAISGNRQALVEPTRAVKRHATNWLLKLGFSEGFLFKPVHWASKGGLINKYRKTRGLPDRDRTNAE